MIKGKGVKQTHMKQKKAKTTAVHKTQKRNLTTSFSTGKSLGKNRTNGYREAKSTMTGTSQPTAMTHATPAPAVSPITTQVAFAPTSKRWNKKRSQSAINKEKRSWIRQRYHGSNYMDPYPVMTMAKFVRLPRPLFIESETLDLFLPAPQVEHLATPNQYSAQALAQQQPY